MNHFNHNYDGGAPNIPYGVGDRYYGQDMGRDFWYLLNESNLGIVDLFENFPVLITDSNVVQGSSFHEIDIPVSSGIVQYDIQVPNNFSSIPPSVTTETILIYLFTTNQIDFDIQGTATLDGVTTNYLKVTYIETNEKSRTRAKKAGSYYYEVARSFSITCDDTAPTNKDLVLAEIIGDDSSFLTISKRPKTNIKLFPGGSFVDTISSDTDYLAVDNNRNIFVDISSGNVTLGLFNGANYDGIEVNVFVTGSGYKANIELFSIGVTDYSLENGDKLFLVWDGTTWEIKNIIINTRVKTSSFLVENENINKEFFIESPIEVSIQLPDINKVGTELFIHSKSDCKITQGLSENCIIYKNTYFSTKGITGYLSLRHYNSVSLKYVGSAQRLIDPGVKISNPASLPTAGVFGCSFSKDGVFFAVAQNGSSPYVTIYSISGSTFTKISDPGTLPTTIFNGIEFSPSVEFLAMTLSSSPFIFIYSISGTTFTKITDPVSLPGGVGNDVSFSFDNTMLAVAHDGSPYVTIYSISGSTFTKISDPSILPLGNAEAVCFSKNSNIFLAVGTSTGGSPFLTIYSISGTTFTKVSDPVTPPTGAVNGLSFSPDDKFLAIAHGTAPYLTIYSISGTTFTKIANPVSLPSGTARGVCWSHDGLYLCVTFDTSPYAIVYKRDGESFVDIGSFASLPVGANLSPDFSPDSKFLGIGIDSSPFVHIYENRENSEKSWIIKNIETDSGIANLLQ